MRKILVLASLLLFSAAFAQLEGTTDIDVILEVTGDCGFNAANATIQPAAIFVGQAFGLTNEDVPGLEFTCSDPNATIDIGDAIANVAGTALTNLGLTLTFTFGGPATDLAFNTNTTGLGFLSPNNVENEQVTYSLTTPNAVAANVGTTIYDIAITVTPNN